MHVPAQDDPPPDDPEFDQQVRCEHGNLSLSSTARRRIPEPVNKFASFAIGLHSLFVDRLASY